MSGFCVPPARSSGRCAWSQWKGECPTPPLRTWLRFSPQANGLQAVVVDLSGVDYINGAGLRVFEKTAALLSQANVDLLVCGLQPPVQAAFDLAGAIPNLVVAASRDAALLQCQRPPRDE